MKTRVALVVLQAVMHRDSPDLAVAGEGGARRRHRHWFLRGDGDGVGVAETGADLDLDLACTSAVNSQLWRKP